MERIQKPFLLGLIGISIITHLGRAQDQKGLFISLDCGMIGNESSYTENSTGLTFTSDADFIHRGKSGIIRNDKEYLKPYKHLRYFPEGTRNCYNLPVIKGTIYLIRAVFLYENYDGLKRSPLFDLSLGPNFWVTIDMEDHSSYGVRMNLPGGIMEESIHMANSNSLDVCLVKTGEGTPFISTLELRPLKDDTYITDTGSLRLLSRGYFSDDEIFVRYPDDVYDRDWVPERWLDAKQISTTTPVATDSEFEVPNSVISNAVIPYEIDKPLISNYWPSNNPDQRIHLYLHFADIQPLKRNDSRVFNILWNDDIVYKDYSPGGFYVSSVAFTTLSKCNTFGCQIKLVKAKGSTSPPLINAVESYGVIPLLQPDTYEDDRMDLSNNNFSGGIPEFLADMKFLTVINLSWNKLNGSIPSSLREREKKGLKLIVEGMPNFCSSPSCTKASDGNYMKKFQVPILASVVSIAFIIVVLAIIIFVHRKKRQMKASNPSIMSSKRSFTYEEVMVMTKNFEIVLGEGGFGAVYHGYLNGNEQVAVKLLSQSSAQGYKQFKAEVELLLRVHHINLVALVGYCDEGNNLALIYDYMSNGDLKQQLSGECATTSLSWESRLQIASETAQGLEYLHVGCQPPMIHRDVKSTNILLDENLQAKLGDFGLSRSFPVGSETHVSTNVAGSPGYLDPEYYRTNRLTEKSDVYSFGIVLLEIITRRPVIDQTSEKPHIAEWVGSRLTNGDIENIVDPSLVGDYDSTSMWKVLELAMSCVSPTQPGRPNMSHVANELKMCLNLRKKGRPDMSTESSFEVSTRFGPEHKPDAR
ncbi:unnamed protein product [Microthlaspi erraticum]|uniref:non-specific serine/threonine protein kinase n=1 Tax=Microthlaspi erraticum TaxID=1685480 RepID=A0A6D2KIF2_9BRAS|nr:unnamed protein product [Microthlaspi erraticum]